MSDSGSPPKKIHKQETATAMYSKEEYQRIIEKYMEKSDQLHQSEVQLHQSEVQLRESEVQRVEYKSELEILRQRYMKTAGIMHIRGAFEEMLCVCSTSVSKAFGLHAWQSKRPSKEEQFGVIVDQNLKEFKTKLLARKKDLRQLSDSQLKEWTTTIAGEVYSKESKLIHLCSDEDTIEIDKKAFTSDQIAFIQSVCDSIGISTVVPIVDY